MEFQYAQYRPKKLPKSMIFWDFKSPFGFRVLKYYFFQSKFTENATFQLKKPSHFTFYRIELEIRGDENKQQLPRCSKPFSSYSDAVNRLLPYHLNQQTGDIKSSDIAQDGEVFRNLCHNLMERKRVIQEKLKQSSMRQANVSVKN